MQLTLHRFRNFKEKTVNLNSLQLIVGENGSGKTSLIEAISLLSTGKSFRSAHLSKLAQNPSSSFILNLKIPGVCPHDAISRRNTLNVRESQRSIHEVCERRITENQGVTPEIVVMRAPPNDTLTHSFGCTWQEEKGFSVSLNGDLRTKQVEMARMLPTVLFNQQGFELIEGSAIERRKFFDWLMFHVEHSFFDIWRHYQKVLLQRNAAIKQGQALAPWTPAFIEAAEQLTHLRKQVFMRWKPIFESVMAEIAQFNVDMAFYAGWDESMSLSEAIQQRTFLDQRRGYTSVGPHRADIQLRVHGEEVRYRLSRGQLKRLYFSLQLARAELFERHTQASPIWLVDDLASELDELGQVDLINKLLSRKGTFIVTALDRRLQQVYPFNDVIDLGAS